MPAGTAYKLHIEVTAIDRTGYAGFGAYDIRNALMLAGTYQGGAVDAQVQGTASAGAITAASDTTNNYLALTWTAPNTNGWHVVARVTSTEVQ